MAIPVDPWGPTHTSPVTIRDFSDRAATTYYNPNFEKPLPISGHETGIVDTTLPPSKVPVWGPPPATVPATGVSSVTTAADFNEWWAPTVDGAPNNVPFSIDLTGNKLDSSYVDLGGGLEGWLAIYQVDFRPFFPIDGAGSGGGIPSQATGGYYGNEGRAHNYGFTLQYNLTFEFVPGGTFLEFNGDDDLFVFVNSKLVLDLGGVHPPLDGGFVLDETTTDVDGNLLNLVPGETYDIDFYYAERHVPNSNLTLTYALFAESVIPEANAMGPGLVLVAGMALMTYRRRRAATTV
jgi:fibro-slime domain-containing protein